ncbi:hypothetical protein D7Z54_07320 [Salibacterium salarium]|uniref:Uncharacterized protein n=1 Tax=Salibacterium salarium TaxID=284579 RepID=A0A428N6L6_9BACI|nr:hypothetical protein [Salibacterium salarium]RSL33922.1 hypothetical protein D7Z54_07320 [Salibacterium salarium]
MDWSLYLGAVLAWAVIRWEGKKLHLIPFLKEGLFICITIYILNLIGDFITAFFNISLSPFDYLPETLNLWIGGIIFFSVVCYLSVKSWKNSSKND